MVGRPLTGTSSPVRGIRRVCGLLYLRPFRVEDEVLAGFHGSPINEASHCFGLREGSHVFLDDRATLLDGFSRSDEMAMSFMAYSREFREHAVGFGFPHCQI